MPKLFYFFVFMFLGGCQLHLHLAHSAPIKFNRSSNEPDENNETYQDSGYPSKYSGGMKNESIIIETKTQRDDDIAYAIPKRYIKWNIGNMDL
ncbi:unnamed protein product [Gulo gulo]|uniref:Uncharacterized protein n=1 Tax=Gulo gulo TaxID=48420 RepID=A0A9X9Q7H4_GULGU|nr:unnamed protein product [Gulo gulo]